MKRLVHVAEYHVPTQRWQPAKATPGDIAGPVAPQRTDADLHENRTGHALKTGVIPCIGSSHFG